MAPPPGPEPSILRRIRGNDAVFAVGLFATIILINGLVAIVAIGVLQAIGVWSVAPAA